MKKIIALTIATATGVLLCIPSANAVLHTDRALWEAAVGPGNFTDVDETQWGTGYSVFTAGSSVSLPSTTTLSFDVALYGAQVPDDWATWSGGNNPRVLWSGDGVGAVSGTFSDVVFSFGLEMQPNAVGTFTMFLASGSTISQDVSGAGGAKFFGWSGEAVTGFTMSIDTAGAESGFAFGRMVEGPGEPPPSDVPDSGSLVWLSGMLWAGLAGLRQLRCRA